MKISSIILLTFSIVFRLTATDYYCDPINGKSGNNGSKEQPWATLQEVFEQKKTFVGGDNILLMNGIHGTVNIVGENESYVIIKPAENHKPVILSVTIGKEIPTSRWRLTGLTIQGTTSANLISVSSFATLIQIMYCNIQTIANSTTWSAEDWTKSPVNGLHIEGKRHKIQFNRFKNVRNGIFNFSDQSQFAYNSINHFSECAILQSANDCTFEYNLLKNAVVLGNYSNAAFLFQNRNVDKTPFIIKKNTLRGNVIFDYTNYKRNFTGAMMGIVSFDNILDMCTFENNLIVTDHWHGITLFNGNNCTVANNTVVDPYLNTIYPNEKRKEMLKPMGPARIWMENSITELGGNKVCNNLVTDTYFKGEIGVTDNNPLVGSTYDDMDEAFQNWEFLDFRLKDFSSFVNAALLEVATNTDANNFQRKIDSYANAGAYEFSNKAVVDKEIKLMGHNSDTELRSNGQKDWDGQGTIRIGGVGDIYNGNAIIPFVLPAKTGNLKITTVGFSLNLEKIDNAPLSNVDVYGLLPRKGNAISLDDYYEGETGKSFTARLIQSGIFGSATPTGIVKLNQAGNANLADFMNSLYEAGYKAGDQFFIRLSHNRQNIQKYARWMISSANHEDVTLRPQISVKMSQATQNTDFSVQKAHIYIHPSPSRLGEYSISFINNQNNKKIKMAIKKTDGTLCYEIENEATKDIVLNGKYSLTSGFYMVSYAFEGEPEELYNFFVW